MRIRSIKPEFWRSLDTAQHDYFTRLLFIGLWSYVDDNGVGDDSVDLIRSDLFPRDSADSELSRRIHCGLTELSNGGQIARYEGPDSRRYLYVLKWADHQKINRPSRSSKPLPTSIDKEAKDEITEPSLNPHDILTEGSSPEQGNKGTREQGSKGARDRALKGDRSPKTGSRITPGFTPSRKVIDQMRAEHPGVDLQAETAKFIDHFLAKTGKDASKRDWDAAWRNWIRRSSEFQASRPGRASGGSSGRGYDPADWLAGGQQTIEAEVVEMRAIQ